MLTEKRKIDSQTKVFALIGYPVEHSISPAFWNSAFEAVGLNAVYVALPVKPENVETAISGLKAVGVVGINITRPHKVKVAECCDRLVDAAVETNVVNTVLFSDGETVGWNTDAYAMFNVLRRFFLPHTKVLILGNGATHLSVLWALKKYGVKEIDVIARKHFSESEEYLKVSESENIFFRKLSWNTKNFSNSIKESDIIINTTPIGWQKTDDIPGFSEGIDNSKTFVDFNYSKVSKLLSVAAEKGAKVIDGRELLCEQGLEAFKLLTNFEPPAEVIRSSIFC